MNKNIETVIQRFYNKCKSEGFVPDQVTASSCSEKGRFVFLRNSNELLAVYDLPGQTFIDPRGMKKKSGAQVFFTIEEASEALRIAEGTVRRYIANGRLNAQRMGRPLQVDGKSISDSLGLTESEFFGLYSSVSERQLELPKPVY